MEINIFPNMKPIVHVHTLEDVRTLALTKREAIVDRYRNFSFARLWRCYEQELLARR